VLGLERGESVGPKTIEAVADALEVGSWALFGILETGKADHSWSSAKAETAADRQAAELDQQAMVNPESDYYKPQGDDAEQVVTWGFMEARLGELEERIERLERFALRTSGRGPLVALGGGEEHGGSAPTSDASDVDDAVDAAAAKSGDFEEPGEFNT
jgi:hypothetical protein